jgi:polyphosphate kinase
MSRDEHEQLKRRLQIELLKLQKHAKRTGARHLILVRGS